MPTRKRELLLTRLNAIAASLEKSGHALALIGLGSAGLETDRLDEFSDLDFFAMIETGHKQDYLDNLSWLSSVCPLDFAYRNTRDGHKVLFRDGVFCEFAVFEMHELPAIPFAPGRIVWKRPNLADSLFAPEPGRYATVDRSTEWLLGEALSSLYAGLCRNARGEKLSAMRCIQVFAVDRVLELSARLESETSSPRDLFAFERRYEQRYPNSVLALPGFVQGYAGNIESALAILAFLGAHFEVNPAMKRAIEALCNTQPPVRGKHD
jgi:hypothetical protein